jgi:two-component system LytT family response regulator
MFKIVVIDDEDKIVKLTCSFIEETLPEVEIVGTANSAIEGIQIINSKKPDLILLDIEMPYANGFELLKSIPERNFDVIFVTAYNQYGIEAVKANALDYILKPIDKDELISAIKKSIANKTKGNNDKLDNLLNQTHSVKSSKIKIQTKTDIEYIDADEIIFIEADGNYSKVTFVDKTTKYVSLQIKHLNAQLDSLDFYRVHKSFIVNLERVLRYNTQENIIEMIDGSKIPIARNKRQKFLGKMDEYLLGV